MAGTFFGKYFLIRRLAQGGMGEIWVARQQGPGAFTKILAIKKVLPHLTEDRSFVQGFLNEAALSAKMTHRNIVQVFDFGLDEESGSYFLAMEYVSGKPLNVILEQCIARRERMPLALIKDVAIQMAEGMSYAHNLLDEQGVPLNLVHRDLNPSNLLLSYGGDVKIIDFGIAKSELNQVKTEAGMIKGKFVYMSPEQSMAKRLDKRSDVFAGGITLYEMLTGENPFHKPNVVLSLEAIQRLDPPPPSEFDPALAPFDPICAKALAKDREKRYQDFADMAEELKQVVVPSSPERLGQFVGRLFRTALEEEQKLMQETAGARLRPTTGPGAETTRGPASSAPPAPRPPSGAPPPPLDEDDEKGGTLVVGGGGEQGAELQRQMEAARAKLAARAHRSQPAVSEPAPVQRTMFIGAAELQPPPPPRRNIGLVVGIAAGFVVGIIGVVAFFALKSGNETADAKTPEPPPPAAPEVAHAAEAPKPPVDLTEEVKKEPEPPPAAVHEAEPAAEPDEPSEPARPTPGVRVARAEPPRPAAIPRPAAVPAAANGNARPLAPAVRPAAPPPAAPPKPAAPPTPAKVEKPAEPPRAEAPSAKVGSIILKAIPPLPVSIGGRPAEGRTALTAARGVVKLGDEGSPMRISAMYAVTDTGISLSKFTAEPWALVFVDGGAQKGKTPMDIDITAGMHKIHLKGPGGELDVITIFTKD